MSDAPRVCEHCGIDCCDHMILLVEQERGALIENLRRVGDKLVGALLAAGRELDIAGKRGEWVTDSLGYIHGARCLVDTDLEGCTCWRAKCRNGIKAWIKLGGNDPFAPANDNLPYEIDYEVIVNGDTKTFGYCQISYSELVELAGLKVDPKVLYTVSFTHGHAPSEGSLRPDDVTVLRNGMRFEVVLTDKT